VKPRNRDAVLILLASVLWGTSFPGSKLAVGSVDPLFLTFARITLGALLGVGVLAAMRRFDLRVFREPLVWVLGAINAVGFDLQNEGILLTTATKTALLVNVNVVIIPALMVVFFREAMTRTKVAGILIGTFGVVVIATKLDPASLAGGQFAGDLLVFVAGVVWAFYIVGAKRMVDRGGDYVALAAGILSTTALLAAIPLFFVGWPLPTSASGSRADLHAAHVVRREHAHDLPNDLRHPDPFGGRRRGDSLVRVPPGRAERVHGRRRRDDPARGVRRHARGGQHLGARGGRPRASATGNRRSRIRKQASALAVL